MCPTQSHLLLTIGHYTRPIDEFLHVLQAHQVQHLVDVRTVPRSRKNPQFNKDTLPASLAQINIKYTHMAGLGGLRKTSRDSINTAWRNDSFRGYADYMLTDNFARELGHLMELATRERVAIMCAEAVYWRCHRSMIADALVARGWRVEHIFDAKKRVPHTLRPFARVNGTQVTYPAQEAEPGA